MPNTFSANAPMQGYFYQPFYALYLLLKNDLSEIDNSKILIENLDDIDFIKGDNSLTLYQNKHHINKKGSISDKSEDLWKTLRIWVERINNDQVDLTSTLFVLTTTAKAGESSIASKLKINSEKRNVVEALKALIKIAEDGVKAKKEREKDPKNIKKHENEERYDLFANLNPILRRKLVENIYILDQSPDIEEIQQELKNQLIHTCRKDDLNYLFEKLRGWWFGRIIDYLISKEQTPITYYELDDKLQDIRDEFKKGNLPIDYENDFSHITEEHLPEYQRTFIEQLKIISTSESRIGSAILDYYRAYQQRSKWLREGKIYNKGIDDYEQRLVNEWKKLYDDIQAEISLSPSENELIHAGSKLFRIIDQLKIPICDSSTHNNKGFYIMRGSYHMLANKLEVGWHPEYNKRLCHFHPDFNECNCFIGDFENRVCSLIMSAREV